MNAFVGKCDRMTCLLVVMVLAFAKANSQHNLTTSSEQQYTITSNFDREQLFDLIKDLKTDQQFEVRLTEYSRNESRLKKLGIAVKPENGEWVEFKTQNDAGIVPICVKAINGQLNYLNSCNSAEVAANEKQLTPAVDKQDSPDNSTIATVGTEKQQANQLSRENSLLFKEQQRLDQVQQHNDRVDEIKKKLFVETDSIKTQKSETKAQLKELQIEVNRSLRQRTTLASSNKREKVRRDSLQAQQNRLQQQVELQQQQLDEMIAQKKANEQLIKKQQEIIEEQGLKAETAESLKAYRTALIGDTSDDKLKFQGYLTFALEQCFYKVYDGYSIVFGNQGNFLFTINKELATTPVSGELKIKGKQFSYNYSNNILYIKDSADHLINEHGEILNSINRF